MKILFTIGPLKSGGAERVVSNLSNYLVKANDVYIAVTGDPFDRDYELDGKINVLSLDDGIYSSNKVIRTINRTKKLSKILNDNKIDVAISFLPEPSYRLMLTKAKNTKKIISDRNDPNREYVGKISRLLTKYLYSKADGYVFQTSDARDWFQNKIRNNSVIIPNPLNPDFIVKEHSKNRRKVIVTVGRLENQKNHFVLINAFSKIADEFKDFNLEIYGSGSKEKELKDLISDLNLNNRVKLMGETKDVKNKIYDSFMFVLSSDYEGMPNALMEAMALGIPSISTNCPCGGSKFLIKNKKNGLLVNVNDSNGLANNIRLLINDKKLYKRIEDNSLLISKDLNPNVINEKWLKYIEQIGERK